MQRSPVSSRALRSVGYDPEAQLLELEFHSGHVYCYEQVPESVHAWLLRARNKGVFVARKISGRYAERALAARSPELEASLGRSLEESLSASLAALRERAR